MTMKKYKKMDKNRKNAKSGELKKFDTVLGRTGVHVCKCVDVIESIVSVVHRSV